MIINRYISISSLQLNNVLGKGRRGEGGRGKGEGEGGRGKENRKITTDYGYLRKEVKFVTNFCNYHDN